MVDVSARDTRALRKAKKSFLSVSVSKNHRATSGFRDLLLAAAGAHRSAATLGNEEKEILAGGIDRIRAASGPTSRTQTLCRAPGCRAGSSVGVHGSTQPARLR